jgi:hypothetical protein
MIELKNHEIMGKTTWTVEDSLLGKHKQVIHGPYIKLRLWDEGYLGMLGLTGFRLMALVNPSCKSTDNRSFVEF